MIAGCPADTNRVFGLNCKFLLTFKFAWQHFGCRPGLSYLMFSQPRAKRKGAANCQAAGCVHMCSGWVWVLATGECVLTGFKIVLIKPVLQRIVADPNQPAGQLRIPPFSPAHSIFSIFLSAWARKNSVILKVCNAKRKLQYGKFPAIVVLLAK